MDKLRILVVDDELGMRHCIRRVLNNFSVHLPEIDRETSFVISETDSGERALELLRDEKFDLMLLDYKLGGMTGMDVLEHLQHQEHDMLVIMITAFATIETAIRATRSGAYDFLAKPFTPKELRASIEQAAGYLLAQRQAKLLAEEKRRIRFDFIRVLGHELKSPLGAIEGYLGLMRDHQVGDDLGAYDQMVERSLARVSGMRKLIVDLLDLTRIESGQKIRKLSEVDLSELARATIESQRIEADRREITLDLETTGPQTLIGDQNELEIILNNLVSNAVKYNRGGGQVHVTLAGDDEQIKLTVRDTGIGMSKEEAGRIFEDFVRIKNNQTRDIEGSGLGLSIVKKIAELYGGRVSVASEPAVGSAFTVTLSRHLLESEDEEARTPELAARN